VRIMDGKSFQDVYEVHELIGAGGQGSVYKVEEKSTGKLYAAKCIAVTNWDEARNLETAARALKQLNGGNIPVYQDFFTEKREKWKSLEFILVTDYISGKNFSERIVAGERFSEGQLQGFKSQVLEALAQAHGKGIVHRDIKPSNVILSDDNTVYVTDFGLAKFLGEKTRTNSVGKGSICYMAPEQINGGVIGPETDYYQLGLTLIALASGRERSDDYRLENPIEQAKKLTHLSSGFRESFIHLVSKNPDERKKGLEMIVSDSIVKQEVLTDKSLKEELFSQNLVIQGILTSAITTIMGSELAHQVFAYMGEKPTLLFLPVIAGGGFLVPYALCVYNNMKSNKLSMDKGKDPSNSARVIRDAFKEQPRGLSQSKYVLMPETSTYAQGVEALRNVGARPLTFKENILVRVEAYESGDTSLFDVRLNSCTGMVYKKRTTKFKIVPYCKQLRTIPKDYPSAVMSIDYSTINGIELDSSTAKYNQPLRKAEILDHAGWLEIMEGDRALLKNYIDILNAVNKNDEMMCFVLRQHILTDELISVFVGSSTSYFNVDGTNDLNLGRFLAL